MAVVLRHADKTPAGNLNRISSGRIQEGFLSSVVPPDRALKSLNAASGHAEIESLEPYDPALQIRWLW